jgi:purine-cytosine permease-like protein
MIPEPKPETAVPAERAGHMVEMQSIDWVPLHQRHGSAWTITPFFFISNWTFFTIALGFTGPALGLSFGWSVVSGLAGMVFGTIFMASHATQGPHMGLPQIIQSRAQFGFYGAGIAIVMAVACYVGFGVVYTVLTTGGLKNLFGWSPLIVGVAINGVGAVLAVIGHDALHRVSRIMFYITLPLFAIFTVAVLFGSGGPMPTVAPGGFGWAAFASQFAVAAAYNIALAPIVSDYTRYLPSTTRPRTLIASVYAGTGLSATWLMTLGSWLATRFGASDALVSITTAGEGLMHGAGLVLAVASVATLVVCLGSFAYSVALQVLTATNMFGHNGDRRSRVVVSVGAVVVWSSIAIPFGDHVVGVASGALSLMLFLLVPWTSINLTDYFIVRKKQYSIGDILDKDGQYGRWSVRGISAYVIGFVSMLPFASLQFYEGFAAKAIGGVDISFLVGLIVSATVYVSLSVILTASRRSEMTSQEKGAADFLVSGEASAIAD